MRRHLSLFIALCLAMAARGQTALDDLNLSGLPQPTQAKALRYWFDDDNGSMQILNQLSGHQTLNVSGLIEGLHTLHYQVIDSEDGVAYVRSTVFLKTGHNTATTVQSLRYWFDDDGGNVKTANGTSGTYLLDASELIEGLHTLHYQITDDSNTLAYVGSSIFLKMNSRQDATSVGSLHYWFDDDAGNSKTATSTGIQTLEVSSLLDGLHTIHYQVTGSDGIAAYIASGLFLKMGSNIEAEGLKASKLMYWFDDETAIQNVDVSEGTQMLDASGLIEGLHTIHYQVLCNNGQMTPAMSSLFLRMNFDTETAVAKSLRYWFDDEQTATEVGITEGIQLLDASGLIGGLHTVHYQIANDNGTLGAPYSSVFLKIDGDIASTSAKSIRYWFDDDATTVKITDVANGTQTLDVSELLAGLHTLNYQLIDSNDKVGVPVTRLFMKNFDMVLADGQNRVTKYQYWLNRNSQDLQTVSLDDATNPYTLIALLPMQQEPLQTSQFHFELTDGVPTIYAKNTFHIRFHDAQGYFTDGDKPFIDYSVKQEVVPVGELQATQTFPKVAETDIRWYTLQAEAGDSLTFKSSQATTIQLFSSSGEELYSASGSESVIFGGCHTWETGTHYLAVHDVTGSRPNMTLDYEHIDKYAILSHTPDVAGNVFGNQFKMHLVGNGLDKLIGASLVHGYQTILMDSIVQQSISKANIRFVIDKDCYAMGTYDLHLYYVDEIGKKDSLTIVEAITLEEALYADVKVDIVDRSTMAKPFPISVVLKNEGNMSYSYIPLNIALDNPLEISDIRFHNFYATVAMENDTVGYQPIVLTENLLGKGVDGAVMFFYIPELGAKETLDLQLDFTAPAHTRFKMYAWTGTPLELDTLMLQAQHSPTLHRANTSNRGQNIITFGDAVQEVTGLDVMPQNVQHAGQLANVIMKTGVTIGSMQNAMGRTIGNSYADAYNVDDDTRQLIKEAYEELYPEVLTPGQIIGGDFGDIVDRLMGFQRECSRNPDPDPGTPHNAHIVVPHDPNDIYGYQSPSGTMFIADSVARVNYTIEFENDTTFATAAAHTIVIKDTLDSRYFDLTKFMPMGIRIGKHEAFLNEDDVVTKNDKTSFVKTIDIRPEINVIAQVDGTFSHTTGIAEWRFTSLDPMTMEPTDDLMQGILPVNYDGTSGIGEVMFEIGMKQGKADGTEIMNRTGIVFDYEEAILTPTWTNIVDAVAPSSIIDNSWMVNDSTLRITADGFDARSGVWKYTWYVQAGENAPWWKEGETDSCSFDYHIYEGIDYGFCVLATDSAGNVEQKVIQRERGFKTYGPDYEDGISPLPTSPEEEEPVYDLSGRQIGNGKSSNGNYPKGVIIRNRKKTLVTE